MSHNGNTTQVAPSAQGGVSLPPTAQQLAELKSSRFDAGIAYSLHTWPALSVAVQNHWGGSNSSEKRDWFAGAISDLFSNPETSSNVDPEYLDEFLLQVMFDEFEVNVDDESGFEVAEQICRLRKQCEEGDFSGVDSLENKFKQRKGKDLVGKIITTEDVEEADDDEDSVDDESEDEEADAMEVDQAQPRQKKEKPPPEVDDDGFTTVRRR